METLKKKKSLSNFLKRFSDKIHRKDIHKKIDTSKMSEEEYGNLVLKELGGLDNLVTIDSCITRLRLKVEDINKINSEKLEELGSDGVVKVGNDKVQIIFGEKSTLLEKYYHKLKNN